MSGYPDIEKELATWAAARVATTKFGSATPANLDSMLPFVRVVKFAGTRNEVTDFPKVDVEVFAASRDAALAALSTIDAALVPRTRLTPGGAIIDSVRTDVSPRLLPWDNSNIAHAGATYSLGLRR